MINETLAIENLLNLIFIIFAEALICNEHHIYINKNRFKLFKKLIAK